MTVITDTGALYALADASDRWHGPVRAWWADAPRDVVVPVAVLPEVTDLLATRIGPAAEEAFVRSVADGELRTDPLEPEDLTRAVELMRRYADLPLGFVDSCVIATAERLGTHDVLTTDRRHFGAVRPRHARALRLLP